jgi:hypothetical protein
VFYRAVVELFWNVGKDVDMAVLAVSGCLVGVTGTSRVRRRMKFLT